MRLLWLPFSAWPEIECRVEVWRLTRRKQPLAKGSQLGIWGGGGGDVTHVTTFEAMEKPGK